MLKFLRNLGVVIIMGIGFFIIHLITSQFILAERSRGEVLLFLRGAQKDQINADAETGPTTQLSLQPGSNQVEHSVSTGVATPLLETGKTFHWDQLCYDITINKESRRILNDIEGWTKPGTLTALMGTTGAGKTTLLDVLSNRAKLGIVSGEVLLNGRPRRMDAQRKIGYVQQYDLHLATSTVREALEFSACLRQSRNVSKQLKIAHVNHVISLLEMETFAHAVIGVPGQGELYSTCKVNPGLPVQ
jgi:ATP-binding cassette subfamily G (WHITE) protein 2 (PDR)